MADTISPRALAQCRALKSSIEAIRAIVTDRRRDWERSEDPDLIAAAKSLGFDLVAARAAFHVFIDGSEASTPPTQSTPKPKAKGSPDDRK